MAAGDEYRRKIELFNWATKHRSDSSERGYGANVECVDFLGLVVKCASLTSLLPASHYIVL